MKRLILGLGVGVFILLCFSTSLQAFDRDINLPSNNQQDPIWIIRNNESDDGGWEEIQKGIVVASDNILFDVMDRILRSNYALNLAVLRFIKFSPENSEGELNSNGGFISKEEASGIQRSYSE